MPHHVVVDGSNIATEGRDRPSLRQLNEAVMSYMAEHPDALITVVVDATFGHRIDAKEVSEFDEAVNNNELVAPPAGAIGRGDAFVLSIANKVNAIILTNDSYQEFHGQYDWLFDEGRLVGGKPVPHIGWVFVNRLPVRGPISRKSTAEAKKRVRGGKATEAGSVRVGSSDASKPMPVPTAPPPGAVLPGKRGKDAARPAERSTHVAKAAPKDAPQEAPADEVRRAPTRHGGVNELLPFITFVERHPLGTSVNAIVDHYSSHGAYVMVGDVMGYVPLRLMADPAPRSAREFMKVGEAITLVVDKFLAEKRSIDLAVPGMGTVPQVEVKPLKPAKAAKRTSRKAADAAAEPSVGAPTEVPTVGVPEVEAPARPKRASKKAAAAPAAPEPVKRTSRAAAAKAAPPAAPAEKSPARTASAKPAVERKPAVEKKPVTKKAGTKKSVPTKKTVPATTVPAKTVPATTGAKAAAKPAAKPAAGRVAQQPSAAPVVPESAAPPAKKAPARRAAKKA